MNEETTTKKRWLLPITILLLLIGGFTWWYIKGSNESFTEEASGEDKIVLEEAGNSIDSAFEKANQTIQETDKMPTTSGMIDSNGNWVPNKSEPKSIKLPNNVSIETYAASGEDKLNMFLSDPASKASEDLWFDFNDFIFVKNKATLIKGYENQLNNLKEILAAYSNLKIKIGAYAISENENTQNSKLSLDRAKTVYQSLLSHGVAKESFDKKSPYVVLNEVNCKEENTNPEGKAKNCRIAICVTEK